MREEIRVDEYGMCSDKEGRERGYVVETALNDVYAESSESQRGWACGIAGYSSNSPTKCEEGLGY